MTDPRSIVIIGAGQAGIATARTLRQLGYAGALVLVGAEPLAPYERPPLSKTVLLADDTPEPAYFLAPEKCAELGIVLRLGVTATDIDRTAKTVGLDNGTRLGYDRLVLSTGGTAAVPPIPGLARTPHATLRTYADALALRTALRAARSVAIIGGGWIGLETAAAARMLGCDVTVLDMAPRLAARSAPPHLSEWLLDRHQRAGIDVRLEAAISAVEPSLAGGVRISLANAEPVTADLLVVGTGLRPDTRLAEQAGLDCDMGILTDWPGHTSDPAIFAVGDVARYPAPGRDAMRIESWDNANTQGAACAHALLSQPVPPAPVPWFWSDQYQDNIQLLGLPRPDLQPIVREGDAEDAVTWLYVEGNQLRAVVALNQARDIAVCRRLMEREIAVDPAWLADPANVLKALLKAA